MLHGGWEILGVGGQASGFKVVGTWAHARLRSKSRSKKLAAYPLHAAPICWTCVALTTPAGLTNQPAVAHVAHLRAFGATWQVAHALAGSLKQSSTAGGVHCMAL